VAEGLSNREIAQRLGLTEHTVKNYLFRIFDKLGVSKRVEVVLYAYSLGGMADVPGPSNGARSKKLTSVTNKAGAPQALPQFTSPAVSGLAKA
jgi:DNA-binding Lrp family transcriptional regulator